MKILLVHNFYQQPGGEDVAYATEGALLEQHGHEVVRLEAHNDAAKSMSGVQLAAATIWNRESYARVRETIRQRKVDLVHFHNTFPLISPAAYYAARREGVPAVQTLHNFRLLCPAAVFFREGGICEICLKKRVKWPAVVHGCYRNSRAATSAVAGMLSLHRALGTYRRGISAFIVLTEFAKGKFVEGGLPADRLFVKPNSLSSDAGLGAGEGGFALFVGRLSAEKGVELLLEAWTRVQHIPLKIVGDGPIAPRVRESAARNPLIEWLGRLEPGAVQQLMGQARALVFPSECYENLPFSVLEAFARGTPVIAPNLGALPSIIHSGSNGIIFDPVSAEGLAAAVNASWGALDSMRVAAREEFEKKYTAERNYERLMEIYSAARRAAPRESNSGVSR